MKLCIIALSLSIFLTLIATAQENYTHIITRQNYSSHTFIKGVLAPPLMLTNQNFPLENGLQFQIACRVKIGKSGLKGIRMKEVPRWLPW